MAHYDSYQSNAAEVPQMRKWVIWALIASLIFHGLLFSFFYVKTLENFGPSDAPRLAKPMRIYPRVTIPKLLDDPAEARLDIPKIPNTTRLQVPTDRPEVSEVRAAPQLPELPKTLPVEKPVANISDLMAKAEAASRGAMDKELNSLAGSLIKEGGPRSPRQPVLNVTPGKPGDGGAGDAEGIPGMQNIDAALARTGPLPVGDKIGMPGGALFQHDNFELRPESLDDLQKLGELLKRNPNATFSIEGHTDSTGSPEYNQALSERRAESVKAWLVSNLRIAPDRIQAYGFGSTKLIVPADKSIDEQQPNRRVEIVIKTNRTK